MTPQPGTPGTPEDTASESGETHLRDLIREEAGRLVHHPVDEIRRLEHVAEDGESPTTPLLTLTGVVLVLAVVFAIALTAALLAYYLTS